MTKVDELKSKSDDELKSLLLSIKKEQLNMRFQQAGGQLTNTAKIGSLRKDVAKIKTLLSQRSNDTKKSRIFAAVQAKKGVK